MHLLVICKDYPPQQNRAGAETAMLSEALKERGITVETLDNMDCWYATLWQKHSIIKSCNADVVHIHYSGENGKVGLSYQLLSLLNRKKVIVTLYDIDRLPVIKRLALLPFAFCKTIIFTNIADQKAFLRICFWKKRSKMQLISANPEEWEAIADKYMEKYGEISAGCFYKSLAYRWF